jgi:hypothetical protein
MIMEKNEIKKLLYKQDPIATRVNYTETEYDYVAYVNEDYLVKFKVPTSDMGDGKFTPEMQAKYLIRWIV